MLIAAWWDETDVDTAAELTNSSDPSCIAMHGTSTVWQLSPVDQLHPSPAALVRTGIAEVFRSTQLCAPSPWPAPWTAQPLAELIWNIPGRAKHRLWGAIQVNEWEQQNAPRCVVQLWSEKVREDAPWGSQPGRRLVSLPPGWNSARPSEEMSC